MEEWHSIFGNIQTSSLLTYMAIITFWYIVFILGSKSGNNRRLLKRNEPEKKMYFNSKMLNWFWIPFFILSLYFLNSFKDNFFQGYTINENFDASLKGQFIALSLMIFSLALVYAAKLQVIKPGNLKFIKLFTNKYFILYLLLSILIITLGGRLYFASTFMCILVFYSVYFKRINIRKFVPMLLLFVFIMGSLGVIRTGNLNDLLDKSLFNIMQEPLYTSFSLIKFLEIGSFEILKFPKFLLSEFVNLVPTFILPNKLDFTLSPADFGYVIYSPLGAGNSFVSFMINFWIFRLRDFLLYVRILFAEIQTE